MPKKSQNQNFKTILGNQIPFTTKNKSHDNIFTSRFGEIKPSNYLEVQPNESFRYNVNTYCRVAPFQAPIYSHVELKHRVFCVPMRKLMPDFEKYRCSLPSDNMKMVYTTVGDLVMAHRRLARGNTFGNSTLEDNLNLPNFCYNYGLTINHLAGGEVLPLANSSTQQVILDHWFKHISGASDFTPYVDNDERIIDAIWKLEFSLLPFLAYKKVIFDWCRDLRFTPDEFEQLFEQIEQNSYPHIKSDDNFRVTYNGQTVTRNILNWLTTEEFIEYPKDYFTTCGDGSQQGPMLSIGAQRLELYGTINSYIGQGTPMQTAAGSPTQITSSADIPMKAKLRNVGFYLSSEGNQQAQFDVGDVWAQVNDADAITPTRLRWQMALQRFLEVGNAVGYNKYTDFVFGHFGLRIPDQYLQRSVLIGAAKASVNVQEVMSTSDGSSDEGSVSLGEFNGRGSLRSGSRWMRGRVKEDCCLITLSFIQPQTYYWQGLPKHFARLDNMRFPSHEFQRVGEEPVYNYEIFAGGEKMHEIFGYNYRYAAEQTMLDEVHGDFRGDLKYWHTGRELPYLPPLGFGFMRVQPNAHNQIFAYQDSRNNPFFIFTRHNLYHRMALSNNKAPGRIG